METGILKLSLDFFLTHVLVLLLIYLLFVLFFLIFELAFPVVDVYPTKQTVQEGGPALMTCVAKGVPLPAISWTFGNGGLAPDATIRNTSDQSILELSKTSKGMEGWYTCRANNEAGDAFGNSTLHVLGLF